MPPDRPNVVVLAGPNGAGKTTHARRLLRGTLTVTQYVNADTIAQGLSGFTPDSVAFQAGEIMLHRLHELAASRADFAFETTLASRSIATWLQEITGEGYRVRLLYFWLPDADTAVARVADRVRRGGHHVPEATIRRRYDRSLRNFFNLYRPIASMWRFFDNTGGREMPARTVAFGDGLTTRRVYNRTLWDRLLKEYAEK